MSLSKITHRLSRGHPSIPSLVMMIMMILLSDVHLIRTSTTRHHIQAFSIHSLSRNRISMVKYPNDSENQNSMIYTVSIRTTATSSTTLLHATKKKRRRKDDSSSSSNMEPTPNVNNEEFHDRDEDEKEGQVVSNHKNQMTNRGNEKDSLPDFDLGPNETEAKDPKNKKRMDDSQLLETMMYKSSTVSSSASTSAQELLSKRNRELEKKMLALDPIRSQQPLEQQVTLEKLPSMNEFLASKQQQFQMEDTTMDNGSAMGKKAQRRAIAIAKAEAAFKEEEDKKNNILTKVLGDDKDGISLEKVVEKATWLGIFILVAWEVYLNSPFFDRAAPLAPFVFRSTPSIL